MDDAFRYVVLLFIVEMSVLQHDQMLSLTKLRL